MTDNTEKEVIETVDEDILDQADDAAAETEQVDEGDEGEAEPEQKAKPEPKQKTVPHQALHAEREARKRIETELRTQREANARLDERLRLLDQAIRQRNEPAEQAPDMNTDPIGWMQWQAKQVNSSVERVAREQAQQREIAERDRQIAEIDRSYMAAARDFARTEPTFMDAYGHVVRGLDAYFRVAGYSDPGERAQLVASEERRIAMAARQRGENPGEAIMAIAREQGWAPKSAQNAAVEAVERRQKAAPAARSLSAVGAASNGLPSAQTLAEMSDDEFAALVERLPESKVRAIFGD